VPPFQDTSYYTASGQLGFIGSAVSVGLIGVVASFSLLFVAAGLMLEARRRARAAKVAETVAEKRELAPGYAIVHGQVETGDALPAVSVRIRQAGREYTVKNEPRHVWTEISREVDARPFSLLLASGERVKVLPGENVLLVDLLGIGPIVIERTESLPGLNAGTKATQMLTTPVRTRTAELTSRDFAYACGRLVPPSSAVAYRTTEEGFTLHPPSRGKMLLSAEPLEERFQRRARFHVRWVMGCVAAVLFTNVVVFGSYWLGFFWGRPVAAKTTNARTWTTSGKSGKVQHYGVDATVTLDGVGFDVTSETSREFYIVADTARARGASVPIPFVVMPLGRAPRIGTEVTVSSGALAFSLALLSLVALVYFAHVQGTQPWYERKKLIDLEKGPLGAPARG
jgi:hypothetical protein